MLVKIKEFIQNYSMAEALLFLLERKMRLSLPINSKVRWKFNISSEIRFWDNCIKTKGSIWPNEYKVRFDPHLNLQDQVAVLLPSKTEVEILDVGAGPLTYLGKVYGSCKLNITAVDPLANVYDKILERYSVVPLIRTRKLDAEKLTTEFSENSFDLVFARNCIDHSYCPEKAILEMLKVAKKNCHVLLMHRPDEAEKENWRGLHQWNFSEVNGDFIVSSKKNKLNFSKKYSSLCETRCRYDSEDDMLYTQLLKK